MKNTLSIFLLLASCQLWAQAPGYLGKRAFLKADFGSMITAGPTANNRGYDYDKLYGDASNGLAFNTQFSIQGGYAVSRRQALLLEASQFKTGKVSESESLPSIFYKLRSRSYGIGYQIFNMEKGGLAPFGNFLTFYLNWNIVEATEIQGFFSTVEPPFESTIGFEPNRSYLSAGLGFGQQRVMSDRILLGYEFRFNVPKNLLEYIDLHDAGYRYGPYDLEKYEDDAFLRAADHNLFYFKIGVGFLLF